MENLDCAFVENALIFIVSKIGRGPGPPLQLPVQKKANVSGVLGKPPLFFEKFFSDLLNLHETFAKWRQKWPFLEMSKQKVAIKVLHNNE